jgi:hypothetical protein
MHICPCRDQSETCAFLILALFDARVCLKMPAHGGDSSG